MHRPDRSRNVRFRNREALGVHVVTWGRELLVGPRRARNLLVLILLCGAALRFAWAIIRPDSGASGEAAFVAEAIANGRGFADAYAKGQGPTAHLLPISPLIAGGVYALFGVRSALSEIILTLWSVGLVFAAFALLYRAFARLGMSIRARLGAILFLCLAPTYIAQESVDFRIWEGSLAIFLAALFFDRAMALAMDEEAKRLHLLLLGGIAALLFFVNPPLGLGAGLCGLVLAIRRLTFRQTLTICASGLLCLTVMVAPWAYRNYRAFHEFVPLRSNAGLELALANHPGALSGADQGKVFSDRLLAIHPAQSRATFDRMKAVGGEVAYARLLGQETTGWMKSHKLATARLALRHLRQIIWPDPWQFANRAKSLRATVAGIAGVLGLLGLLVGLISDRRSWMYPATLLAVPALALSFFQPVSRYTYLFFPFFVFAGAYLIDRCCSAVMARRAQAKRNEAANEETAPRMIA